MEKPAAAARPEKIPAMRKDEYDALIRRGILARIAFSGTEHPYIAPFMYVFDEHNLYFLSTRYGRKMDLFAKNPAVSVEIEEVAPDMSAYRFVTLQGNLAEVTDTEKMREIRSMFAERIARKTVSANSLAALGYRPSDDPGKLVAEDRTMVWKLTTVRDIVALKES